MLRLSSIYAKVKGTEKEWQRNEHKIIMVTLTYLLSL